MIDLKLLRERPQLVRESLKKRGVEFPFDQLLELDRVRRAKLTEAQALKTRRNRVAEEIARTKRQGGDATGLIEEMRQLSQRLDQLEAEARDAEARFYQLFVQLPNIPDPSVPVGPDETHNVVVRSWGTPPVFDFTPKDHIELGLQLGLIDLERAAKVAGARFYFLRGELVRLNYALIAYALDFMKARGFALSQPPYMMKRKAMEGVIILSDFEDVIYKVEGEDLYLIGTAEHPLAAMHMGEVLDGRELPLRYCGVSPCFRKEAGAHGRDTKGIFRVHQFEKVEQFIFCRPEESQAEHELLLRNAEEFFQSLGIPYRVVLLCTGDLGKVAAKTYDIEAWLPGQRKYREVVSCSNCTDYQARSLRVMYREKPHEEARLVHTLNSTLVATERALIAILENYQTSEGTIKIPRVLQPYMGGCVEIS
jgi:seryl-tRNA synthetase